MNIMRFKYDNIQIRSPNIYIYIYICIYVAVLLVKDLKVYEKRIKCIKNKLNSKNI